MSKHDGPFNWIVGGFYNQLETAGSSSEFTPNYPAFAGLTDRPDALEYFSTANSKLVETALYGEVGYDITDQLSVTVGGRLYEYELEAASSVDFPLFEPLSFTPQTLEQIKNNPFDPALDQSDDGFLYKLNVSYDVTEDLLVCGTISEGYRIGASNGIGECTTFDPNANQGACALAPGQQFGPNPGDIAQFDERQYGPDTTTNYEIGVKSTLLDGDLNLNAAVFFVEWTDPQVDSATVNAGLTITINAEGAESKGIELSGDYRVNDNFSIRGAFSHTVAELTADVPSLVRTITPPGFGTAFIDGESGDRLPGSPETQFSFFGTYALPLNSGDEVLFNLGYAYQGDVLTRTGGRGNSLTLDEFGIANGSIVYNAEDWKAALFVNNIFDEYAEVGARSTPLLNQTINGANVRSFGTFVAPSRAVGVRFSYDFE